MSGNFALKPTAFFTALCAFAFAVLVAAAAAAAPYVAPKGAKDAHMVDFAGPLAMIDTKNALLPYKPPSPPEKDGSHWYMMTAVNDSVRPATRILQAGSPPGAGLRFLPSSTRPEILQVASSEAGILVENTNAYGRKSVRVTIPPATSAAIAIRMRNATATPSLLAWTEPALAAHNRQLAILLAAVAGLIAAAAAIIAGVAVMTGHAAPRWAALFIFAVLLTRLAASGMFDASIATGIGGPYGLIALFACLALAAGIKLTNLLVPLTEYRSFGARYLTPPTLQWTLRGLVVLGLLAYVGIPGAALLGNIVVLLGTLAVAAYIVERGRHGAQTARVLAPAAAAFALVTAAAAVGAFGGFGDNFVAPTAVGGFAAAGAVLLALAIAAGEGISLIPAIHFPQFPHLPRSSALAPLGRQPRAQQALSSQPVAYAIAASQQGVFDLDLAAGVLTLGPEAAALCGLPAKGATLSLDDWFARVHSDDRAVFNAALGEYSAHPGLAFRMEFRVQTGRGRFSWFELRATMLGDGAKATRCLGLLADVSVRKQVEASELSRGRQDGLTGLGNRLAMMATLEEAGGKLKDATFALLDIDRFKAIHSSLGHEGADALLQALAQRLNTKFGHGVSLFRVGGDSFAFLIHGGNVSAAAFGAEIVDICGAPYTQDGRSVFAPVSVGVALGGDAEDPLALLRNAELALLQAKRQGGGCARVYVHDYAALAPGDSVRMEAELRDALSHGQIDVYYQPIVRLRDGSLAGFEALLRWHHPVKGLIAPSDFIAHSESTGLIVALGRLALERTMQDLAHWQRYFPSNRPLFASVNVSRRQLRDPEFEPLLNGLIARGDVAPGTLKLEVTESAIGADTEVRKVLERFRKRHIAIAIDDFGTGLSSLSELGILPFDTVKIDKGFLARHGGTDEEGEGGVILGSIVSLAHELKRDVIVEGVESAHDATWLRDLGCEYAQGFHFSPALPAAETLNFIALHCDTGSAAQSMPREAAARGDANRASGAPGIG
ncbi:MAG: EAL domain-containing protein [Alphaproteobacteria bacterium]|nr:EAL domain-containing protein [Alphaproteobacteria bacterium]